MGTKKKRSGIQYNPKGATQGNTLVCPKTGDPIDCVEDTTGKNRLCVDADLSADNITVTVDKVKIWDEDGDILEVEADGSINVNCEIDAADGDNIAISDGTNTAEVTVKKELRVVDALHCGGTNTVITVTSSPIEVKVGALAKVDRKSIVVVPKSKGIYWGFKSNVDTTDGVNGGILLGKNQPLFIDVEANTPVYLVGPSVGVKVSIAEA